MYIRYAIVKDRNVKFPERAHCTDAGIDFYVPEIDAKFINDFFNSKATVEANNLGVRIEEGVIIVEPGHNACIPSGIKVEIMPGKAGIFHNKSGVASKKDAVIGADTVDAYYEGEVHIDIHNIGTKPLEIKAGDKLAQMVIIPVDSAIPILCDEEDLYMDFRIEKYRGDGGFGSTNKKS